MKKIERALISVSDKTGIAELAMQLSKRGVEIISTGGTAKLLKGEGVPIKTIDEFTGFPEMLDGRVKTLHPKVHAGLLSMRDNPAHQKTMQEYSLEYIDLVVVNLYPFEATIKKPDVTFPEAIENDTYLRRIEQLEKIAGEIEGVQNAFAVQAGRELRVIVDADSIDDNKMLVIARDIAKRVSDEVQFPGQIKVCVVRETRVVEYAK